LLIGPELVALSDASLASADELVLGESVDDEEESAASAIMLASSGGGGGDAP
jgi:hypothetical protein